MPYKPAYKVSNAPFREAFLRDERTALEIARQLGWMRSKRKGSKCYTTPNDGRLRHVLGLRQQHGGSIRTEIPEDLALELLAVFPQLDPVDVDV